MPRLRRAPSIVLALAALCAGASAAPASAASACAGADVAPTAANVAAVQASTLCLLNERRAQAGVGALRAEPLLTSAATRYSARMVSERFFAHVAPDGSDMMDRLKAAGYLSGLRSWSVGENLAWGGGNGYTTPNAIVQGWMRSPGHKANILEPSYRAIGIGVALGAPVATGYSPAATYTTEFGSAVRSAPRPRRVRHRRAARSHRRSARR